MSWDDNGGGDWFPPSDDDWLDGDPFGDGSIDDTGFPDFDYWDDYTAGLQDWLDGWNEALDQALSELDERSAAAFREWGTSVNDVIDELRSGYKQLADVENRGDLRGPFAKPSDAQAVADTIPAMTELVYDQWSDLWYIEVGGSP
jgi:hypothetical protein